MCLLKKELFILGIVFSVLTLLSAGASAQDTSKVLVTLTNQDCFACHANNALTVDQRILSNSVHRTLSCVECHKDIKKLPHADNPQKVDCSPCHEKATKSYLQGVHGQKRTQQQKGTVPRFSGGLSPSVDLSPSAKAAGCSDCHGTHDINKATDRSSKLYWVNIPKTCGKCHQKEYTEYSQGIHGQVLATGNRDAPVCTDCHGEHDNDAVKRASSKVSSANIPQTCGQCHAAQRINAKYNLAANVFTSYMQSYHGLAMRQGSVTAANCASCHGAHEILPSSDQRSMINPKNLEKTCGQCHPGIGSKVAHGAVHGSFIVGNNPANDLVRNIYIFIIFFVSGLLLLHNVLDFSKKAMAYYRHSLGNGKNGMGLNERWQHFILVAMFIVLAYTGFSLKFPQTWWSCVFFGHGDWLRWGHRGAGLAYSALALYHIYYLFFTQKGRWQLIALSFNKKDLLQIGQTFQYYFNLRKNKPELSTPYGYVQKLEYWALLWGSWVMVLTGSLMFNEVWFLQLFPKWFYDIVRTVHAYEAILAFVTILIWHGYFVIFDPDVYPGNWSWLHGRHPIKQEKKPKI